MRVDLGKGRWAEVVEPDDMTHGVKMRVQALLPGPENDKHMYINELEMREALIAHLVTSWSFDLPLPGGDPAKLADVPGWAYDALVKAAEPHWRSLDFLRIGESSSNSETSSTDTESPDSSPDGEQ